MNRVYPMWHVREDDEDAEDAKFIGVYSSEEEAKSAIDRLKDQPGFKDYPAGFQFSPYEINKDHWTEGFISWDEAYPPDA